MKQYFSVPGKPRGKGRPRMTKSGHAYTPQTTREYEQIIRDTFTRCCLEKMNGALKVTVRAWFEPPKSMSIKKRSELFGRPYKHKPDLDNIVKTLDALNGVAFDDDSQVVKINAEKLYGAESRLDIILETWEGEHE